MMKWNEIKLMSEDELARALTAARADMVDLRFKASTGGLKQVNKINARRKDAARILTRLTYLKTHPEEEVSKVVDAKA